MIQNWSHPKARKYSAATYEQVFEIIYKDPTGIIDQIYNTNALPKWKRDTSHFDDFVQELCLNLTLKYQDQPDELVLFFNTYFNYWLTLYTKNQVCSSTSGFAKRYGEKYESLDHDTEEPPAFIPFTEDKEFDLDDIRDLKGSDDDVLLWLIKTDQFTSRFDHRQLNAFRKYVELTKLKQRRVKIKELSRHLRRSYNETRKAIIEISALLRERIALMNE